MKGYAAAAAAPPGKRRWRCLAVAVLALVFCSLLVPLAVLLGLHHNRFPSGYLTDDHSASEFSFGVYEHLDGGRKHSSSQGDGSRIDDLVKKLAPTFAKDLTTNIASQSDGNEYEKNGRFTSDNVQASVPPKGAVYKNNTAHYKNRDTQQVVSREASSLNTKSDGIDWKENVTEGSAGDESGKSCQLLFGSYCLWSLEHKEVMKDSTVKRLKDQLFVARAYYPSIAKLQGQEKLTYELKQHIQEHERMLSEAISDADLLPVVDKKIQRMDEIIAKAKSCAVDCHNIDKKLRQLVDLTEDEAHFHMKQSAFLYHLGVQTMHKSLHCLSMRLTVEYFKSSSVDMELPDADKLENPNFHHYVIFSLNVLAASVTINSTVMNSEESENLIFHLVTDRQNFYACKHWFVRNRYKEATVHVLNFDDLKTEHLNNLGIQQLSPSEEFRVSIRNTARQSPMLMRTEYISVFGHSHFLLADIFSNLNKVVVLDDDVLVKKDLSFLWNLDLQGKVIGAVQYCRVRLRQLGAYLGGLKHDANSCAWMSGLNVVDLEKWRDRKVTEVYHGLHRKFHNGSEASWRAATLPTTFLAFQDLIYPLQNSLVQSGLGHNYGVTHGALKNAAALHYNGNMKPWLELGIPKYKKYWKKYLTREEQFMSGCNVNP
ncbi:probable galacturonosyltransferase 7 [Ananas comosus]|uniref:Hexosyltransferase n=1 Tax=Ananas comosus TaxID=4615 RepID=A0A6P5GZN6_ANACO|nr:probable galacturonosyltransferase 7 [Ananas comosus]